MTTPDRVRRFVTPFATPLCDLPAWPEVGDTYRCDHCLTEYRAEPAPENVALVFPPASQRVVWHITATTGCAHPPETCEPAGGNAAVGARTIANAWSCNTCGNWVVDADEPVVLA